MLLLLKIVFSERLAEMEAIKTVGDAIAEKGSDESYAPKEGRLV